MYNESRAKHTMCTIWAEFGKKFKVGLYHSLGQSSCIFLSISVLMSNYLTAIDAGFDAKVRAQPQFDTVKNYPQIGVWLESQLCKDWPRPSGFFMAFFEIPHVYDNNKF